MKSLALLVAVVALTVAQETWFMTEIHTKTGGNEMDEGFSHISFTVFPASGQSCYVQDIDEYGNTFIADHIDAFWGPQIGSCYGAQFVNGTIDTLQVSHTGSDDIFLDWVRFVWSNYTYTQCEINGVSLINNLDFKMFIHLYVVSVFPGQHSIV